MIGISAEVSEDNSSLRSLAVVMVESCFLIRLSSKLPPSLVHTHKNMLCFRSAKIGLGQSLRFPEVFGRILDSLASVGRRQCSSFQTKLVASEPRPLVLACFQLDSQSVVGEASSVLDLIYSLWLSASSTMVISCSTINLYHWAVDMVATFKGLSSLTFMMVSKKESE